MKRILKQLGGSVTSSNRNDFRWTVLRLTAYYTGGVVAILLTFSFLVYGIFTTRYDRAFQEGMQSETISFEIKENLSDILIISDIFLLSMTVIVAYALSKKTLAPLEETYQKQKRFVADAAHELRTPLAVMKAGAEVLLEKERKIEDYQKFTKESLEEVERLITLSNDLLFLTHSAKTSQAPMSHLSLSAICKKQCELITAYAHTKDVAVRPHVAEGIFITGIESAITRLVLNLLKNAVDYNREGGTVDLSLQKKDTKALLIIEDSGIGIASKDLPHIFERFYKADSARTYKKFSGTGLGLAIASEISKEHNGSIEVHSVPGKGTRFNVSLPLS